MPDDPLCEVHVPSPADTFHDFGKSGGTGKPVIRVLAEDPEAQRAACGGTSDRRYQIPIKGRNARNKMRAIAWRAAAIAWPTESEHS
jgi:hypothetical protein